MTLPGVSRTAIGVARVRARESGRTDRLFDDPFAARFAALADEDTSEPSPARRALAFQIIIRTRFYDDWLLARTDDGIRQVVLVGAGVDARAWRLPWPARTRLFEVDLPGVLEVKEQLLHDAPAPAAERHVIAADLTGDWRSPLVDAGFDPAVATAWLAEGLLVYLDRTQGMHVLTTITEASAAGSAIATERVSPTMSRLAAPDTAAATGLWQGGLGDDLEPWLHAHGWRTQFHRLDDVASRLDRPMGRSSDTGFVVATQVS